MLYTAVVLTCKHMNSHGLHTRSPGPPISGFIFDINLLGERRGWGSSHNVITQQCRGIIEVNFSKRSL